MKMNLWDILILLAVAGAVALGVVRTRRRKASGRGGCCESCGSCTLCANKSCASRKH